MDELHGILKAYEMRTKQENPITKEEKIKASKKTKKKNEQKPKLDRSCNDDSKDDEEMENFARKLKRGTNRYKGMLPLKCFQCGGILILLLNVLIRINKVMKKIIRRRRQIKRIKETKIIFSRKVFAPRKTTPHQMRMKSVKVRPKEFYSWK